MSPSNVFFFNDTATTEIYTLSLHDALPIFLAPDSHCTFDDGQSSHTVKARIADKEDRKSTRLNSSHVEISYAVFCVQQKKNRGSGSQHRCLALPVCITQHKRMLS